MAAIQMQYVNGGTSFPTLKIPYQNNRYFCEILILSLKISKKMPPPTHYTLRFAIFCTIVFLCNLCKGGGGLWVNLVDFKLILRLSSFNATQFWVVPTGTHWGNIFRCSPQDALSKATARNRTWVWCIVNRNRTWVWCIVNVSSILPLDYGSGSKGEDILWRPSINFPLKHKPTQKRSMADLI